MNLFTLLPIYIPYRNIHKLHHVPMHISTATYLYLPITENILIQCRPSVMYMNTPIRNRVRVNPITIGHLPLYWHNNYIAKAKQKVSFNKLNCTYVIAIAMCVGLSSLSLLPKLKGHNNAVAEGGDFMSGQSRVGFHHN